MSQTPTPPDIDSGSGMADVEPTSCHVTSQGIDLHYLDWGNAGAPLLILVHGNRDHARSWDWTALALRDRYHVVALDLRGHGDSAWSPDGAYLMPYHLLDLVALVDHLGAARFRLVGHSFGGSMAWRYAGLFPDRVERLVIVDGLGPDPVIVQRWDEQGVPARSRDWIAQRMATWHKPARTLASVEDGMARMHATNPRLSPDQLRHLATHGLRAGADGLRWKYDPMVSMFAVEDFAIDGQHYWRQVTAPTLLMYGAASWTTNPDEDGRAVFFPDARTMVFDDAGHWLHHDRLDAFVSGLRDFLLA